MMPAGKWNSPKQNGRTMPSKTAGGKTGTHIQKLLEANRLQSDADKTMVKFARTKYESGVPGNNEPAEIEVAQHSGDLEKSGRAPITVLIADDHPVVREGLSALIRLQPDMKIIAEASNGREAMERFLVLHPDVALLDLRMPLMDGIETVVAICEKEPGARLAILTSYESEEEIYRALRAGAQGYILKDAPAADLIACLRAISEGRTWIPSAVGAKLAKRVTGRELTTREMEVLRTLVMGKSNKEIGVILDITESTVKVHVTHVLEKLKASGRAEAIGVALQRGLIRVDAAQEDSRGGSRM
jgi:two-component system, NarL family, response regulator